MKRYLSIITILVAMALVFVNIKPAEAAQQLRMATGQVTQRGEKLYYTVDVAFGQALYAVLSQPAGSRLDPYLRLLDSNEQPFVADDDSAGGLDAMILSWPLWPGRYYLEVSGVGNTTGAYSLIYGAFQPWGDSITTPNEEDRHTFTGRAGDSVWIQSIRSADSELDPYVKIIFPDGSMMTERTNLLGEADVLVAGTLPQSGRYTIYVGGERRTTGDYTLLVTTYRTE